MSDERIQEVGKISHFFSKIGVAIIDLTNSLSVGDRIRIIGSTTDFEQKVESMEIEHKMIQKGMRGDSIGLKVEKRVRANDIVYKIIK
jgi:translation elongation factor EF-1alpha